MCLFGKIKLIRALLLGLPQLKFPASSQATQASQDSHTRSRIKHARTAPAGDLEERAEG